MKTFLLLLKNSLFSGYYTNQKKKNGKQSNPIKSVIFLFVLFIFLSTIYNFLYISSFINLGLEKEYLVVVLVISGLLTFFMTFLRVNQTIYHTKDYEFLEALPITKTKIVASKLVSLYLFDLATSLVIVLPAAIIALCYNGNFTFALSIVLFSLFISMIPLALAILVGFLITLATAKLKHKNIFTVILYGIFFILLIVGSFFIGYSTSSEIDSTQAISLVDNILNIYPPAKLIVNSLGGNILQGVLFILASIASFGLAILVVGLTYHRLNNWLLASDGHRKYVVGKQKGEKSGRVALFKKEIAMLTKNPMNLIGYAITPIMGAAMLVVMPLMMQDIEDMNYFGVSFGIMMCTYMVGLMNYSLASVSLEGKSIGFLKSLPLSVKDIITTKLSVGILIALIPLLIGIIVFNVVLLPSIDVVLASIFIPILALLSCAFLSMLLGLRYPVFTWDNPTVAMKNSKASLITTFVSLGINMIPLILVIALSITIPEQYMFIVFIGLGLYYGVFALIFGLILKSSYYSLFIATNDN